MAQLLSSYYSCSYILISIESNNSIWNDGDGCTCQAFCFISVNVYGRLCDPSDDDTHFYLLSWPHRLFIRERITLVLFLFHHFYIFYAPPFVLFVYTDLFVLVFHLHKLLYFLFRIFALFICNSVLMMEEHFRTKLFTFIFTELFCIIYVLLIEVKVIRINAHGDLSRTKNLLIKPLLKNKTKIRIYSLINLRLIN